jgi:hypothetical protein
MVPAWTGVSDVPADAGAGLSEEQALPRSESVVTSESTGRMAAMRFFLSTKSQLGNTGSRSLIASAHKRNPAVGAQLRCIVAALCTNTPSSCFAALGRKF